MEDSEGFAIQILSKGKRIRFLRVSPAVIVILHKPRLVKPALFSFNDAVFHVGLSIAIPEILIVKPYRVGSVAVMMLEVFLETLLKLTVTIGYQAQLG